MDWKYWRKHPAWEGSRGFVMEREGEIVAHGSVMPLRCAWGDRRLKMVEWIDWAAQPKATGAGIALLKEVGQSAGGVFIAGGSEMARKILPALGFRKISSATKFALPLRPLARLRYESFDSWRPFGRFGRNVLWKLRAGSTAAPGWSARRLPAAELAKAPFPTPHPTAKAAVFERSAPELAYFLECPVTPGEFYLVEQRGAVRGYFILTLAFAQCRIADAWLESDSAEDWEALYRLAAGAAKAHPGIAEVVTAAAEVTAVRALTQLGFAPRGPLPLHFWLPGASPPADVRYQMLDNDASYLHSGKAEFWT